MVITGLTRNAFSVWRFRPHKTLDSSGFRNIKIEYFFLFSPVVLSKYILIEKTTVQKINVESCPSGRRCSTRNAVSRKGPRVRIPNSPPKSPVNKRVCWTFLFSSNNQNQSNFANLGENSLSSLLNYSNSNGFQTLPKQEARVHFPLLGQKRFLRCNRDAHKYLPS